MTVPPQAVGKLVANCEHHVLRRRSLALKLDGVPEKDKFVQQLIGGAEVPVPGGPNGDAARQLERMLTGDQVRGLSFFDKLLMLYVKIKFPIYHIHDSNA